MAKPKFERSKPVVAIGTSGIAAAVAAASVATAVAATSSEAGSEAIIDAANSSTSLAPTNDAAGTAVVHSELNAAVTGKGAAATPSGSSVPDGSNTSAAVSGVGSSDQPNAHEETGAAAAVAPVTHSANTPESTALTGEAGNSASLAARLGEILGGDDFLQRLDGELAEMEAKARGQFPLFAAAIDQLTEHLVPGATVVLKVTARVDGFRRAGIRHPAVEVAHDAEALGAERIEAILAERQLISELVVVE